MQAGVGLLVADVMPIYMIMPRGSPGLGGLRTAGLYPLAGLLDYEDTRLKTSSRVQMGLYLAWKASLGNTDM